MAQPPKEDKKLDFSSLPRGAIGIKGLPVSRNTRLPSIRSPRDLTLGAPPKRTFMPNIPVRREKKSQIPEDAAASRKQENIKIEKKNSPQLNDRGKGRGRFKQIIQTQSSIFTDGISADTLLKKEKTREAYHKTEHSGSSRGVNIKKEKLDCNVGGVTKKMNELLRDDFIDDGSDDDIILIKPTVFPPTSSVKKENKVEVEESTGDFDPNIAKEMDFDVNLVAKFIKKEKGTEAEEKKKTIVPAEIPSNEITNLLNGDSNSKLVLLEFPDILNVSQKMDDSEPSHKKSANAESKTSDSQNCPAGIKSLPEGYIGKIQVMKSGKTKLVIGGVEFLLDSPTSLPAKHEVVSINSNSDGGDLTVLGYLQQKLRFVPDEDSLLE